MGEPLPDPLVVIALAIEAQGLFERERIPVLYTGLGKVNAAYRLARRLADYRAAGRALPQVVNFGTAGSRRFPAGTTVECTAFVQRDMDVTPLGFALGQTPFEDLPATLEVSPVFEGLPRGVCGTADRFETGALGLPCDVVDMEAYALAKVCHQEGARFACAKYISDGADEAAATSWEASLPRAAAEFLRLYRQLRG